MTPVANPQTRQEQSYNYRHVCTHSVVECTIRVLKARWMCLDFAGGKLLYTPEKACLITMACCTLHNMAMRRSVPLPEQLPPVEEMPDDPQVEYALGDGIIVQQQLTDHL